jgi:hypothetical protein
MPTLAKTECYTDSGTFLVWRKFAMLRALLLAIPLAALPWAADASTHLVLPDGTGDFPTIQAAIDAAEDGDVIELADGTFRGSGNRSIQLTKGLTIRSASGDPERCIIDCEGEYSAPARGLAVYGPATPLIQGLKVMHGFEESSAGAAAVSCGANATFLDCVFSDNVTEWSQNGGGVCCYDCSPVFVGCRFERNVNPGAGGGVAVWGQSAPRFERCIFSENTTGGGGGGCSVDFGSAVEFSECVFWGNSAIWGAAVSCYESGARLDGCTIVGNTASAQGGGLSLNETSSLDLSNTILAFNQGGTAVYCPPGPSGSVTLICCDVFGNEGGDWVGCLEGQLGLNGNISADPLFCDPEGRGFGLHRDSPCAPEATPTCGLIGALPVGCGGSPAQVSTPIALVPFSPI